MSVQAMNHVWKNSLAKGVDKFVLLAIADHADKTGNNAFPGSDTLAAKTGLARSTVQLAIKRLVAIGELAHESRGHRGVKGPAKGAWNRFSIVGVLPTVGQTSSTDSESVLPTVGQTSSTDSESVLPTVGTFSSTDECAQTVDNHPEPSLEPSTTKENGGEDVLGKNQTRGLPVGERSFDPYDPKNIGTDGWEDWLIEQLHKIELDKELLKALKCKCARDEDGYPDCKHLDKVDAVTGEAQRILESKLKLGGKVSSPAQYIRTVALKQIRSGQ